MERLSAADAWYLYLESPVVHLHVTGLLLLDPSTAPTGFSFKKLRRHVAGRLDVMGVLRRRLVEVPMAIDHPTWIEDPAFDLDNHLHHHVLPGSGSTDELALFVGGFSEIQLDRSRPLWDMVVVEGLDDGRVAVVTKMHHCIVDGVSGVDVMAHLLDLAAVPKRRRTQSTWDPEEVPSSAEAVVGATWNRATTPLRPVRAAARVTSSMAQMARTVVERRLRGADTAAHPLNAPRTRLNGSITKRRSVAFGMASLEDMKTIKRAFGVTVNDVVLAACTAGLRTYLETHDHLPDRPLVCSVPVSVHGQDGAGASTNQVSNMFVNLPVHLSDPVDQLQRIHAGSIGAKEIQGAVGVSMISDVVELIPPTLFHFASRMYSQAGLADRMAPVHNLIISNVPGSPVPLFLAGARVVGLFPFGPLMEGTGLNITILSNLDDMNIGLIGCPDLVPGLEDLLDAIITGIDSLLKAAAELDADGGSVAQIRS